MKLALFLACLVGALLVCGSGFAAETVDLMWSPEYSVIRVGESVSLGLNAVSGSGRAVKISAMDVVMSYDPSYLWFRNYTPQGAPYQWKVDGFLTPSPDGINLALDDGLMMYTAWAQLGLPAYATERGLRVTTMRFDGAAPVCRAFVSIPASVGSAKTRVFDGIMPSLDIRGQLKHAAVMIVPEDYSVSIAQARNATDASLVKVGGPIVTRTFGTYFYIEDANRVAGIRVNCSVGDLPAQGTTPRVEGVIRTVNGERVIDSILVDQGCPMDIPGALVSNTRSLTVGLSPVGLLVRIAGVIQAVEGGLALNDGSDTPVVLDMHGMAAPAVGAYAVVTGTVGREGASCVIRVNHPDDVLVWQRS